MDTILGILGLALAIASLVPAFTATKTKLKIVAVAITLALIGVIGVQVYRAHTERTAIESAKEDVLRLLVGDNPLSFDQIYGSLNLWTMRLLLRRSMNSYQRGKFTTAQLKPRRSLARST